MALHLSILRRCIHQCDHPTSEHLRHDLAANGTRHRQALHEQRCCLRSYVYLPPRCQPQRCTGSHGSLSTRAPQMSKVTSSLPDPPRQQRLLTAKVRAVGLVWSSHNSCLLLCHHGIWCCDDALSPMQPAAACPPPVHLSATWNLSGIIHGHLSPDLPEEFQASCNPIGKQLLNPNMACARAIAPSALPRGAPQPDAWTWHHRIGTMTVLSSLQMHWWQPCRLSSRPGCMW